MSAEVDSIVDSLKSAMPDAEIEIRRNPGPSGQDSVLVGKEWLVEVCRVLRDDHGFDFLSNLTGVDWPDASVATKVVPPANEEEVVPDGGFLEVVYHLYATEKRLGPVVLRCRTADRDQNARVPSVVSIFRSAEFQEREAYDLFGIIFEGHPDLRRILMWDEFEDYPMRKDYVAPDDYEYEPTPHDAVLEKAKRHYPSTQ